MTLKSNLFFEQRSAIYCLVVLLFIFTGVGAVDAGKLILMKGDKTLARFAAEEEKPSIPDLGSMTFLSTVLPAGKVTLLNGEYREPAAPGSASENIVKLTDKSALGEAEGKPVAAVIMVTETGGSGSFYDLALLLKDGEKWVNTDVVFLGDRVKIDSMAIQDATISLTMTVHKDGDPQCCPSNTVVKRFTVKAGEITPFPEEKQTGKTTRLIGPVWQWVGTIYNNDTKTVPPESRNYTIRFRPDGKLSVKADCNMKGGTYSLEHGKLAVTILNSTMAMCREGSLEDQFVKDLTAAASLFLNKGFISG